MKTEKTWEELCEEVRTAELGFVNRTPEETIEWAIEVGEKEKHKDNPQRKEEFLLYLIHEYKVSEVFRVGEIVVKRVGDEYPNREYNTFTKEDGTVGWKITEKEGTKAKYYMFKTRHVDAIDAFSLNIDHTLRSFDNYHYCSRDEIVKLAQQHSDIMVKRSEDVIVEFPTGKLQIANFFHEKDNGFDSLPDDIKYNEEYSINHALGRQNTAKWLAENRNLAYGQLGNTSCSIYKVNDDKLVVVSQWSEYDEFDDKVIPLPEGWEHVCDVSCGVWRIELVDQKGLDDYGFDLEGYKKARDCDDFGEVQVNAGTWEMKTYYNQRSDKELYSDFGYPIWAELNRISGS